MAECKHELKYLIGRADGIHCMACGAILDAVPETAATAEKKPVAKAAPRKGGKTNARK